MNNQKRERSLYSYIGTLHPTVAKLGKTHSLVIDTIFECINRHCGIGRETLRSKSRKRKHKEARQLFHYFATRITGETREQVAFYTNNHHSTVIHSIGVVHDVMSYNKKLVEKVEFMEEQIHKIIEHKRSLLVGSVVSNKMVGGVKNKDFEEKSNLF